MLRTVYKKWWLWVLVIAVIALGSTGIGMLVKRAGVSTYTSKEYKVSLKYPSDWVKNPEYDEKYQGENGFFQLSAFSGERLSIDDVANMDAFHQLKPYGSDPQIIEMKMQGQKEKKIEARLIVPSADQVEEWNHQAAIIMKYPEAVNIGDVLYNYFILWADIKHVEDIGQTVRFSGKP
ncbi:peptidase M56 [Paenibacillus sp. FSL E2-0201]|uniref:peptidase M56 n=1 Tax=Paenibacillus sp. FSL E2-0201 TaxID=2954726 RepID=UPI0030DC12DA